MLSDPQKIASFEQAEKIATAINELLKTGSYRWTPDDGGIEKPTTDWTFERYGAYWLTANEPLVKASTTKFYGWNLAQYLYPAMGRVKMGAVDRDVCRAVVKGLLALRGKRTKQPLARKTRQGILATLSAVLVGAIDDNLLTHNPANRLGKKYLAAGEDRRALKHPINPYTFEESDRFLKRAQHFRPDLYPWFYLLLRTGVREGESIELRWTDFPAHRPQQDHVHRSFSLAQAKKDRTLQLPRDEQGITTPKNGRDRYVDCSPSVLAVLKAQRLAQRERAFKKGRPVPELCYTGTRGERLDPHYVLRTIVPYICTAPLDGVPKVRRLTIHALRHTYVTQMLLKHGRDKLRYVSGQIGHRDLSTTENIYDHWLTEHHDEVLAARLDEPPIRLVEDL
jgi:integrase